jgi:hypothetical protein
MVPPRPHACAGAREAAPTKTARTRRKIDIRAPLVRAGFVHTLFFIRPLPLVSLGWLSFVDVSLGMPRKSQQDVDDCECDSDADRDDSA